MLLSAIHEREFPTYPQYTDEDNFLSPVRMSTLFVFVHGWKGSANSLFIPLLRTKLSELGFPSAAQSYPNAEDPIYPVWKAALLRQIQEESKPGQKIVLIGHSLGGYLVLRLLGEDFDQPWAHSLVGAVIVSGTSFADPEWRFCDAEINWDNIKRLGIKLISLYSEDDDAIGPEHHRNICQHLTDWVGFQGQLFNGFGHFQVKEAPPITEAVLSYTN